MLVGCHEGTQTNSAGPQFEFIPLSRDTKMQASKSIVSHCGAAICSDAIQHDTMQIILYHLTEDATHGTKAALFLPSLGTRPKNQDIKVPGSKAQGGTAIFVNPSSLLGAFTSRSVFCGTTTCCEAKELPGHHHHDER